MADRKPALLYALASMGMGHAVRAEPLIAHLCERYDVHVFTGGPAYRYLSARFANVKRIHRPRYFFRGNRVAPDLIYLYIALTSPLILWSLLRLWWARVRHRPRALITDFETQSIWSALLLRPLARLPIISIDNQSMFRFAEPLGMPTTEAKRLKALRFQALTVVPFADRYLVASFAQPKLHHPRAQYITPPIRADVLKRRSRARAAPVDAPVLAYLGLRREANLHQVLSATGLRFVVFGAERDETIGPIAYRTFAHDAYLDALADAPFVLVSAGHSSICDALTLGKPVLAYPSQGQLEQEINAWGLEALGVGQSLQALEPAAITAFAHQLPRYRSAVQRQFDGFFDNAKAFATLDEALAAVCRNPSA